MEFSTHVTASPHQIKTPALAVGVFTDGILSPAADIIDRASHGAVRAMIKTEFTGRVASTLVLRQLTGVSAQRVVLVGLGKQTEYNAKTQARAEHAFAAYCAQAQITDACSTLTAISCTTPIRLRARSAAQAVGDATYYYNATIGKPDASRQPKLKKYVLWVDKADLSSAQLGLAEGSALVAGMSLAKTLGNLPGNICTPSYLGDTAKQLGRDFKSIKVNVLESKQIEALHMGSFLSVSRGSDQPPRFIVMHYKKAATPTAAGKKASGKSTASGPIVLVGKGVTFDAGGISIKPAATMDEMKFDMCGAASVIGTLKAVAELELPIEVIGLIPACENLLNGSANKPGDVVTSMSGQTIEILNTDAEGRLILCDALTYAERFKPQAVIDIATLTGACVTALGKVNSGLFATDDALADALLTAGKEAQDPAWRMPLDEAYQEQLKSNFADMANIGGPPAGAVTAACFLSRFTKAYSWAHLDIAGTAWKSGADKGSTARPVPMLLNYLITAAYQ
ncbi:aminopeptidase A [Jezberella montanilacus]|jgi:leucyl aminopeptidase|uniref:Probable cytosol aminopeptidase n=1 Tax=Jezberella montanilacus TaxID=323426 RepID=A0A2T0XF76_9BURK|nr:leucyl aminopeptidase [Jezberella montanilacus]PRY97540.1 aminopeptidase A [Jezberella montanilacus]